MTRNRFNPRQRWEEDRPLVNNMVASTVAGITFDVWVDFVAAVRFEAERKDENTPHMQSVLAFADQVETAIKWANSTEWLELPALKARVGRGSEITIEARDYSAMRSFLTNASLGIYDRRGDAEETPRDGFLHMILKLLDKSSDRRKNTWDYRDQPISQIMANECGAMSCIRQRLAAIRSDIKFRKNFDSMWEELCAAAAARKVEKAAA